MSARPPVANERRSGDLLVRFHYIKADPAEIGGEYEPMMVITRPLGAGKSAGFAIALSAAHLYINDGTRGGPSNYCIAQAANCAGQLDLTVDKRTCYRICELILDSLPDLLKMPPWTPPAVVTGEYEAWIGSTRVTGELSH